MAQNLGHSDRPKKHNFDINKIDYDWIEKTNKVKELKLAYDALEEDGYFMDLLRKLGEKIVTLDPSFARRIDSGATKISAEEQAKINSELNDFFADAQKTDVQLRKAVPKGEEENASIFSNGITVQNKDVISPVAQEIEKKQAAENERVKGNECVKAKEYSEAVACYTRSLALNTNEPFTYANRAMAYIKMKDYRKAIDDANTALKLKPGYLKAYHRRGKSYAALNEHESAIKDFQTILESEPENKEVNKDLMAARTLLNDQILKEVEKGKKKKKNKSASTKESSSSPSESSPKVEEKKNKFVRVAIEEDSDDEEEDETDKKDQAKSAPSKNTSNNDPIIEEVSSSERNAGTKWWAPSNKETKVTKTIQSKFPLQTAKECLEHTRESKRLMQKGGDDFMKKFNQREQEKVEKEAKNKNFAMDQNEKLKELENTQKELEKELAEAKIKEQDEKIAKQVKEKAAAAIKESERQKALEKERKKKKDEEEKKRKEKEAEEAKKKQAEEEERQKAEEAEKAKKKKEQEEAEKAKKLAEAEKNKAVEEKPKSSETKLSAADQAKYDKQKPKVDNVLKKVETKKEKAAEEFKLGQYGEAIKSYKAAVTILESAIEDFPLFKKELTQMEATVFNNMAACCRKELNSKAEIEYSTKVIERSEFISDKTVLLKAFLRRGLAYEQIEKYLKAKEDMHSVKELQYDNKQASQCLNRVNKAIKDIYGDKIPEVKKNQPIKMAKSPDNSPKKAAEPVKEQPKKAAEPVKEQPKKESPKQEEKVDEEKLTKDDLSQKFTEVKEAGNEEYKRKMWVMAIAKFGEGISIYEKNKALCESDKELKSKVAQLYTNRALSWHQLDNQDDVLKDCTHVLKFLDDNNAKALFRRSHSYKAKGRYYESIQDLEKLMKLDPNNKQAKKELITVKQKLREQDKEPAPQVKQTSSTSAKIQEVSSTTVKPTEVKEETTKGKFSSADSAPVPSKPAKTKMLDKETVDKAATMATDKATQEALNNIPKTAAGLEKDFNQLKRDLSLVYQYAKKIPLNTIISLYKKTEVSTEVLAGLLNAYSIHGLTDADSCKHTCQFLSNLSKADNFDMTLMFMEDREQKMIVKIKDETSKKLTGNNKQFAKDLQSAFNI